MGLCSRTETSSPEAADSSSIDREAIGPAAAPSSGSATGGGTARDPFDRPPAEGAGGGWNEILSGLKTLLETGVALPFQSGPR